MSEFVICLSCGGGVCSGGVVDSVGAVGSGCVLCGYDCGCISACNG